MDKLDDIDITDALRVTIPCSDETIAKIKEIGIDAFKEHLIMQLNIELAKYIDLSLIHI